ncbi:Ni/Fe hydrogenase subunit alpha [Solemya pervernicosa gill symbiont]|uniref:Ni/Fe hydrogenase subunit alpha n=2 Tax=Gammaproteobacteria incertae sedis TaxID=118884 RepID=A0A1T2L5J8_9GAMM|nr:Ni/Fe hydrogenase subunit alpha [Candidatus Reidiella endopervernicosa]OOZ40216.1 Ni/Fe hydrogenase subunit alpha [Solemya pervernicosa gill symbiont]QKQ27128.1 Ni/Fe hydrogenase subunit alpha [Candidatus Reidiella endopervernicosa]
MSEQRTLEINVPVLARVEGEGALELKIEGGAISELRLRIFEPPRYFEKFLEGRHFSEVPDIVARICGICPVAYQMSAVHAFESIYGANTGPWVREMRRLIYCGEWIESHALHMHLLALPDFLGFGSVIGVAKEHPDEVRRGLRLQALGNDLIKLLGGRSVHPVGAKVGGFYHVPSQGDVDALLLRLHEALPEAEALVDWLASLDLPDDQQPFVSVAMRHPNEYPMNEGRLVSSSGLDIAIEEYERHFSEHHVPHSTALHSTLEGQPYLVGPLARLNLNLDRLPDTVKAILERSGIRFPSQNMFHSLIARGVELHYAIVEAIRILEAYRQPTRSDVEITPRSGIGFGCSEAPRGILWHRYESDGDGRVVSARIVPPTAQNQMRIEEDLRLSLNRFGLDRDEAEIRLHAETVIRNYDPCISCATHFLDLTLSRDE